MLRLFFVVLALAGAAHASKPPAVNPKLASKRAKLAPPVELTALNTHETFTLRPGNDGQLPKTQRRAFSRFLRCHHTGRSHAMAPRLAELLYKVARHFDGKRVLVVAGYRAPKIARQKGNPKSPHKQGLACDFRIDGIASTAVRDYVRATFHRVGIGWYPNSDFVHLDVRQKDAFWVDYSGPGERARYAADPSAALAAEREPKGEEGAAPEAANPQEGSDPGVPAPNYPALIPVSP